MARYRFIGGGGAAQRRGFHKIFNTFLNLGDTPSSYTGQGLKLCRVNAGENGLEFVSEGVVDEYKVMADGSDTAPNYLNQKITGGNGINVQVVGAGNRQIDLTGKIDDSTVNFDGSGNFRVKPLGITDAQVAAANKDGTAGTPSMRTLGTGSAQAAAGDHDHTTLLTKGIIVYTPGGITTTVNLMWWYLVQNCTVVAVRGCQTGGTAATVNVIRYPGGNQILGTDLSLPVSGQWYSSGVISFSLSNADYILGQITGLTGTPTQIIIQIDYTKTVNVPTAPP